MLDALANARVGVVVLDRFFLGKTWTMLELRALMKDNRTLPVR